MILLHLIYGTIRYEWSPKKSPLLPTAYEVRGKECFHRRLSVHRGVVYRGCVWWWHSGGCLPRGAVCLPVVGDVCPWLDTPTNTGNQTPLPTTGKHPPQLQPPSPRGGHCHGRYASYWNAFLFHKCKRSNFVMQNRSRD